MLSVEEPAPRRTAAERRRKENPDSTQGAGARHNANKAKWKRAMATVSGPKIRVSTVQPFSDITVLVLARHHIISPLKGLGFLLKLDALQIDIEHSDTRHTNHKTNAHLDPAS